jgi:hypothetical protein
MQHGNRLMRGPVILGVMDVKHADRDNLAHANGND